jgi:hypothetical protein
MDIGMNKKNKKRVKYCTTTLIVENFEMLNTFIIKMEMEEINSNGIEVDIL